MLIENHLGRRGAEANVSPVLDPSTISLDHAWWLPERNWKTTAPAATHVPSNANVIGEAAGCGESGFGNNCSRI